MEFSSNLITPVVLCGGYGLHHSEDNGSEKPKPFQNRSGNLSIFQQTLLRVSDPGRFNPPMIVADQAHQSLIEFQMEMIGIERSALVLEPVSRGTAPSLALAALVSGAFNDGGSLLVVPCHHLVRDPNALVAAIDQGVIGTRSGSLLAFGRKVSSGDENHAWMQRGGHLFDETGDGVVDAEVYRLHRFIPKSEDKDPDALADGGDCYRNSGMYLFPIISVLEELRSHAPEVLRTCQQALVAGTAHDDILVPNEELLANSPDASIEHALMENTGRGALVPTSALWSEEGVRQPAPEAPEPDVSADAQPGKVVLHDASNSQVLSSGPLTVVAGVDDVVVVNAGDAVIVAARSHVAELLEGSGDVEPGLPQAALEMLREAVQVADEPAGAEPGEPVCEEGDGALAESGDGEAEPSGDADDLEDALNALLPAEDADDQEPPLLLLAAMESAA